MKYRQIRTLNRKFEAALLAGAKKWLRDLYDPEVYARQVLAHMWQGEGEFYRDGAGRVLVYDFQAGECVDGKPHTVQIVVSARKVAEHQASQENENVE